MRGEVTSDVARGSSVAGVCVWVGFLASLPSVRRLRRRPSVRPVRVGPEGSVQQRLARPKADHAMKIDLFRFLAQTSARDRVASSSSRLLWRSQGALLFLHLISTSLLALVRCARCSQQPAGGTTRRLGPPFRPSSPDGWVDGWVRVWAFRKARTHPWSVGRSESCALVCAVCVCAREAQQGSKAGRCHIHRFGVRRRVLSLGLPKRSAVNEAAPRTHAPWATPRRERPLRCDRVLVGSSSSVVLTSHAWWHTGCDAEHHALGEAAGRAASRCAVVSQVERLS